MIDNLALFFVHGALGILVLRLIMRPDPDDLGKPRARPIDRFRRRPGADD